MSYWTCITGTIRVRPRGRTQHEKTYILNTILDHLPKVTGSEGNMDVYVIQKRGHNASCSHDEFGVYGDYSNRANWRGWIEEQDEYLLTIDASLRDRMFNQTVQEFMKWLIRLSKRCIVQDVLVRIEGYEQNLIIDDDWRFYEMYEWDDNWTEYLMWERDDETGYPKKLVEKYRMHEEGIELNEPNHR